MAVVNTFEPSTFSSKSFGVTAVAGYRSPPPVGVPVWNALVVEVPGGNTWLEVKCKSLIGPSRPAIKVDWTPGPDKRKSYEVAPIPPPGIVVKLENPDPDTTWNVPIRRPSSKPVPVGVFDRTPPLAALSKKREAVPPVAWNVAVVLPAAVVTLVTCSVRRAATVNS